ncbi:hypothetical protein [Limnohabitans sp.]|uniref:hypothetical protein n=1 Tax=Limnohabitans sp. TaxID=1907725 RepID=UPI00286FAAFD|nr:hypothetical protein [Limnohabitans sp.]
MTASSTTTIITPLMYYRGRDKMYANQLTPELRANAARTLTLVNKLIVLMAQDGITLEPSPLTLTPVSSGWRPVAINAATPGAAARSLHITCEAIDLYDPEGELDDWCMSHLQHLQDCALYLEHPAATKGWCHLQTRAPRSGNRVFYP